MKVYLDDVRPSPDGWVWIKTVPDAIAMTQAGLVDEISLDNDLGDHLQEGWRYLAWLETEAAADSSMKLPKVRIHTSNPVARRRMQQILDAIERNFPRK